MFFKTINYTDGEYNGETNFRGKPHGFGTMELYDGGRVSGDWKNGQLHGHAVIEYKNGDDLGVNFVYGVMQGYAIYHCANGEEYEINFVNGKKVSEKRIV